MPPDEKGWEMGQRDALLVSLGKRVGGTNEIVIVWGSVFKLPAFGSEAEFVRSVGEALARVRTRCASGS
ncbi:MAG: hypothetical protein ACRELS_20515 [Candidatus Rokuibacteriota bacterium]